MSSGTFGWRSFALCLPLSFFTCTKAAVFNEFLSLLERCRIQLCKKEGVFAAAFFYSDPFWLARNVLCLWKILSTLHLEEDKDLPEGVEGVSVENVL